MLGVLPQDSFSSLTSRTNWASPRLNDLRPVSASVLSAPMQHGICLGPADSDLFGE